MPNGSQDLFSLRYCGLLKQLCDVYIYSDLLQVSDSIYIGIAVKNVRQQGNKESLQSF